MLFWQEAPGLVVTVTGGLSPDELRQVAEGLVAVDDPPGGSETRPSVIAEGTIAGLDYRVERSAGEGTGLGDCVTLVLQDEAASEPACSRTGDMPTYATSLEPVGLTSSELSPILAQGAASARCGAGGHRH